jgi:hypothetical protein
MIIIINNICVYSGLPLSITNQILMDVMDNTILLTMEMAYVIHHLDSMDLCKRYLTIKKKKLKINKKK